MEVLLKSMLCHFKSVLCHSRLLWLAEACISHVLYTWCLYNGFIYNQRDGITKELPLAPVIADNYMECFKWQAISLAAKEPAHWHRYLNDTFVVWTHRKEIL
jgi:hypothetical protein